MEPSGTERKSHKRFRPQDPELQKQIHALMKADTRITLITFAAEWTIIFSLAALSWLGFTRFGTTFVTVFLYLIVITLIGSRQRALECLIHEGTHVNLSRNLKLNDFLACALAALPLGHNVKMERRSHLGGHHKYFWDLERDPDYKRYRQIGIDQLPVASYRQLLQILARGFLPYMKSTIPAFFVPRGEELRIRFLRVTFWAVILMASGFSGLLIPLVLYWVAPFLITLILIRYFGEASEHSALGCTDEFGTTRNNLGWLNQHFIHPRGDAYHLVHHLYPKVPFHKMAQAHRLLMNDPVYSSAGHHCTGLVVKHEDRPATLQEMAGL